MRMLVLAKSYKFDNFCVAGIDLDRNNYIRIGSGQECDSIQEHKLIVNGKQIDLMDVINIDVKKLPNKGCQTENYELIKINNIIAKYTIANLNLLYNKLNKSTNIFGSFQNHLPSPCHSKESLVLLRVNGLSTNSFESHFDGKTKRKCSFWYNGNLCNEYSLTDSKISGFQYRLPFTTFNNIECYVMISLPEDNWAKQNSYYKYVAGVIPISDVTYNTNSIKNFFEDDDLPF